MTAAARSGKGSPAGKPTRQFQDSASAALEALLADVSRLGFVERAWPQAVSRLAPWVDPLVRPATAAGQKLLDMRQRQQVLTWAGLTDLAQGNIFSAAQLFGMAQHHYLAGYCYMLLGQISAMAECWRPVLAEQPNHWCASLLALLTQSHLPLPSIIQVRNHLEMDVFFMQWVGQTAMLNNLLMATPWLARLNPEAYKLAGRGLYHAGNAHLAQQFLLKGQAHMPHDPETYHHLALIYWQQGDVATVRTLCQAVLLIVPTFWPAQQLLAQTQVASNAAST